MNYKEKYNQALERARDVYTYYCDDREQLRKIESIFPELKECDDKRIKREIVDCINAYANLKDEKIPTELLDWLEGKCKNENRALPDEKRMDSAFTNIKFSPNLNKEESMNIQEDYCSYELCKLLEEKGFDEECEWYYPKDGGEREQLLLDELNYDYQRGNFIKCYSHASVMKWLREEKGIDIGVTTYMVFGNKSYEGNCSIDCVYQGGSHQTGYTYEEVVEKLINYSFVNLI